APGAAPALREGYDGPLDRAVILGGGATATSTMLALADLGCGDVTLMVRDPARATAALAAARRAAPAPAPRRCCPRPAGPHGGRRSRCVAWRTGRSTRTCWSRRSRRERRSTR